MNRELARQQALLAALFPGGRRATEGGLAFRPDPESGRGAAEGTGDEYGVRSEDLTPRSDRSEGQVPRTRGATAGAERGLQAYRANAGAAAERALASSFPVVRALVGAESFAALARAWWQARPPARGDLAWLGAGFADFVERDPQLADVPYLADVARLEWLLACADLAPDAPGTAAARLASLHLLADHPPHELFVALAPGAAVLRSAWPVASLWRAHGADAAPEALAAVRERVAARTGETVFVWRPEWAPRVEVVDEASACFLEALARGHDLARALAGAVTASAAWSFEDWLARAISAGWLAGARHGPAPPGGP
jgi:hypothetical protein